MEKNIDYIKLVKQAKFGDRDCLNRLAEAVRERLRSYIYHYTLKEDFTNDILQETLLKMLEGIGELRKEDQFWPWLYKIAINKIRFYHRKEQQLKVISDPDSNYTPRYVDNREVAADMIYQEFKDAVIATMKELKTEHRSIIHMRCYDQMQYSEIAKTIGCSEFAAQKLFYRAKKSLKKKLVHRGLGRGSLLMALILFGKLTAPSKAAAASITVTSATFKVGKAASMAAAAASKKAIVSLATAGVLTAGILVATFDVTSGVTPKETIPESSYSYVLPQGLRAHKGTQEFWYCYPSKTSNVVMMRVKGADTKGENKYCQYLQNSSANYYFDKRSNTVHINNFRQWQNDLSVWRLPTDSVELSQFLTQLDGTKSWIEDVNRSKKGLLLVAKQPYEDNSEQLQITYHCNVLGEDFFKYDYDWPANVKIVDNRDVMHKRGWTYFTVSGWLNDKEVKGSGRMPFVYGASQQHWPWMKLDIGEEVFVDKEFTGLFRPWAGLHTIDTIRRHAAEKQIPFETKLHSKGIKAQVILTKESQKLIYFIDMEADVVEQIIFTGDRAGRLIFDYLQKIEGLHSKFAEPRADYRTERAFSILGVD